MNPVDDINGRIVVDKAKSVPILIRCSIVVYYQDTDRKSRQRPISHPKSGFIRISVKKIAAKQFIKL